FAVVLRFIGFPVGLLALGFLPVTAFGLVIAAVNIHHFFVDGVIWKLREPATSSALMTSLAELGGPAIPAGARAWNAHKCLPRAVFRSYLRGPRCLSCCDR